MTINRRERRSKRESRHERRNDKRRHERRNRRRFWRRQGDGRIERRKGTERGESGVVREETSYVTRSGPEVGEKKVSRKRGTVEEMKRSLVGRVAVWAEWRRDSANAMKIVVE